MATLDRTFPFTKVKCLAVLIRQDLNVPIEHAPDQPANDAPGAALAVSTTGEPPANARLHSLPQSMPGQRRPVDRGEAVA